MLFGLEPAEREVFPNPPLKTIIAQVRFLPVPELLGSGEPQALREAYPSVQRVEGAEPHWRLTADGGWALTLGAEFLAVEADDPGRVSYAEVRERLAQAWSLVHASEKLEVGLRYINHIERDDLVYDWSRVVNGMLLGLLAQRAAQQALEVSVNNWMFRVPAGLLVLNHGLMRLGKGGALGYLLDLDCTTIGRRDAAPGQPVEEVLDELHDTIAPLFRWCLGPDALEEFRRS